MQATATMAPTELRRLIRSGDWTTPTSGAATGFLQANLVMLPASHAFHFLLFCTRNAKPCPVLDVLEAGATAPAIAEDADLHIDVYVDGVFHEEAVIPTSFQARRHELCWKYKLEDGEHTVKVVWKDPAAGYTIDLNSVVVYGPEPSA